MALYSFLGALFPNDNDPDVDKVENEGYDTDKLPAGVANITNSVILAEPRAYSESQTIADQIKKRNSVVVNLKKVTHDQARRIIDFLSGTLYALGGSLQKLGNDIYLCTPKNVNVEGKISDEQEEKKNKTKIEDEMDF